MGQGNSSSKKLLFKSELEGFDLEKEDKQRMIRYYVNEQTKERRLIHSFTTQNQKQYQQRIQSLNARMKQKNLNVQKLISFECFPVDQICSVNYTIYSLWEYYNLTLKDQFDRRRKNKQNFTYNDLHQKASMIFHGMEYFQRQNIPHQKLSLSSIMESKGDDRILICDPLTLQDTQPSTIIHQTSQHIYLPPEISYCMKNEKKCVTSIKGDVWTMGLILLELGLLQSMKCCYQQQGVINLLKLQQKMKEFEERYTNKFGQIIKNMLEIKQRFRNIWSVLKLSFEIRKSQDLEEIKQSKAAQILQSQIKAGQNQIVQRKSPQVISYIHNSVDPSFRYAENKKIIKVQSEKENCLFVSNMRSNFLGLETHNYLPKPNNTQKVTFFYQPPQSPNIFNGMMEKPKSNYLQIKKIYPPSANDGLLFHNQPIRSENQIKTESQYEIKQAQSITHNCQPPFRIKISQQTQRSQGKSNTLQQQVSIRPSAQIQDIPFRQDNQNIVYVIQHFKDGTRYQGQKVDGQRHGKGKFYYQDGCMYDGQWKENKIHGRGKIYYKSGALACDGTWKEDTLEGFGKLYNQHPISMKGYHDYTDFNIIQDYWQSYEGYLKNDTKEGEGKLKLTNGQYFEGSFKQDMISGTGVFVGKSGTIRGQWYKNKLVKVF